MAQKDLMAIILILFSTQVMRLISPNAYHDSSSAATNLFCFCKNHFQYMVIIM